MTTDVSAKGKCFTVTHSTGCTCCSYQNYSSNLYLDRAKAEGYAKHSLETSTIGSQYAEKGVHKVVELEYEIAGEWIILENGQEALKFLGFTDDESAGCPLYSLEHTY